MKSLRVREVFPFAFTPVFYQAIGHGGDGQVTAVIRAEIPGTGIFLRILPQGCTELQISAEGFQDMLPRPDGTGIADTNGLISAQSADTIGDEAVSAPVAAADDVACSGGGCADGRNLRKERFQISAENELCTPFGRTVGVMAAHRIVFPVSPYPFVVLIAFVAGDIDQDFDAGGFSDDLKHIDRTADVCIKGQFRLFVGEADKRLRGQMKNKFRLIFFKSLRQQVEIADISIDIRDFIPEFRGREIVGFAGRIKGIADNIRPQFLQPDRQPGSFETCVTGDQNLFIFINIVKNHKSLSSLFLFLGVRSCIPVFYLPKRPDSRFHGMIVNMNSFSAASQFLGDKLKVLVIFSFDKYEFCGRLVLVG